MRNIIACLALLNLLLSCNSDSDSANTTTPEETMYFPPTSETTWETKSLNSLNWNETAVAPLLTYLNDKHTKSFILLVNGRIVMENYFNGQTASDNWYWASAGKTLTSTLTGIAQQEGLLNINNKVSDYLGTGWTSVPLAKENLITCKHLLTMTSGLDDAYNDSSDPTTDDCVLPDCLMYKSDAGTRWAYDNVYVKLQDVVANASGQNWNTYFNTRLRDKIGMNGNWITVNNNSVYTSTARSMARFGLLALNKGNWNGTQIVSSGYFDQAATTSQSINLAYGYLWWLNGKANYHLPQTQLQFSGSLIPSAPSDMYCALGKNDQKIYIIPSKKMVIIRMGDTADGANMALSDFDEVLWQKIKALYE
ncbi:beta-lactamase family protein [Flavobacterium sp. SM15]|uniref:serine hydrolase domain-containing protein n=1 Tax=Flavobacterium sp. SM15 TaxID=2908005 RepID=UPI001EDB2827|nr:serine hydrolase [Flavobacterium sp. SM15]MCG2611092.1 beta-lactamase family protein [Flavobacterium sp. SM15]